MNNQLEYYIISMPNTHNLGSAREMKMRQTTLGVPTIMKKYK